MRIVLTKNWGNYTPGNELDPETSLARTLVEKGYARVIETEKADKAEKVERADAVSAAETTEVTPTPDAAPRRKRGRPRKVRDDG